MLAALLFLAALVQPADERVMRQRAVAGWLVADIAESDGGRLVRMHRSANGFRLQFHIAFWRGNAARIQGTLLEHGDCTDGDEVDPELRPQERHVRAQFAAHLATCAASPPEARLALRGFAEAYAVAAAWADEAEAATDAERRAIADYGREN
ncbi:MAG TPA: hypothetical protein VEW04_08620 [Allosphingosinicella sp.]|nr:hypothetical protein [Allosphingosinicella sp.]